MTATRLYLVRHGVTEWNGMRRYQGQTDTSLSPLGVLQAQAVARRLAAEDPVAVYSSDLERARTTAVPIAQAAGVALESTPLLRELNFGEFEGKTSDEILQSMPDAGKAWWGDTVNARPPGGETLAELDERVRGWWSQHQDRVAGQRVVVVGHGGSLNRFIGVLMGLSLDLHWRLRLLNASVTTIEIGPRRTEMLGFNDVCHLRELG
jgi:alpha-ribazole phosphatase